MRSICHIAICVLAYTSLLNVAIGCFCTKEYDPLCCDGTTYSNYGCAKCKIGLKAKQCPKGECPKPPCVCNDNIKPVCCNGETYSNYCRAKCELGPKVAQCVKGKCKPTPKPSPKPTCFCPKPGPPVCCNGETYPHYCRAKCAIGLPAASQCVKGKCKPPPKPMPEGTWYLGQKGATCDATCSAKGKSLVCDAVRQSSITSCASLQTVLKAAKQRPKPCPRKTGLKAAAPLIAYGKGYFLKKGVKSVCNKNKPNQQLLCHCTTPSSKAESVSDWIEGDMYDDEPVAAVGSNSIWVYVVYAFAAMPFLFCICVNIYYLAQRRQRAKAAKASYAKVDVLVNDEEENEKLKVNL